MHSSPYWPTSSSSESPDSISRTEGGCLRGGGKGTEANDVAKFDVSMPAIDGKFLSSVSGVLPNRKSFDARFS